MSARVPATTTRLLVGASRRHAATAAAPLANASTCHRGNRDASSSEIHRRRRRVVELLASGAAALALCAVVCGDDGDSTRCEPLQRLDTSNRRPTGTTRKTASGTAAAAAGDFCQLQQDDSEEESDQQQTEATAAVYFDAEYETKSLIGAGTFGMVLQCVSKKDGHMAAVKMVQDLSDNHDEVSREKQALSSIQQSGGHENIIRYDGSYAHNGFHYIVTEYVPGDSLHSFLEKRRQFDVRTALQLVAQLADALAFLQQSGIVHRDLKPENIMVLDESSDGEDGGSTNQDRRDEKLKLKIIDFGSAGTTASSTLQSYEKQESTSQPAISLSGTRCYWSPEVLQSQEMTPAMDMWSLGCLLYIMISGRHPFDLMGSSSEEQIVQRVTTDSVSFVHPAWTRVPQEVKELVRGLLEKDPRARFSVDDVLSHKSVMSAVRKKL
ncbi:Camk protein kinase [Globisporangium polare]